MTCLEEKDYAKAYTYWNIEEEKRDLLSGKIFTEEALESFEADGAMWSWFMIWHTDHITGNSVKVLNNVYNDEKAITLDELPDIYS